MPKNVKDMKFNPNRDADSSFSEANLREISGLRDILWIGLTYDFSGIFFRCLL